MMRIKPSAIGYYLLIHPDGDGWAVSSFNVAGLWSGGSICKTKAEAKRRRAYLIRHHKKLAKARELTPTSSPAASGPGAEG